MHPDEFYKKLFENATVRKKRTLTLINEICRKQSKAVVKDFSIRTIASLLSDKGGPGEQSLRNQTASAVDYRALINQWAEYTNGTTKKERSKKTTDLDDSIYFENIPDQTTKVLVLSLLNRNKRLEADLSKAKKTFDKMSIINEELTNDNRRPNDDEKKITVSGLHTLTDSEINALRVAISDEVMHENGWTIDEYGGVNTKDYQIFKSGFVTAIKKVLKQVQDN
jgi:hypothetical protein